MMEKQIAKLFTYIFQPFFIPLIGIIILFNTDTYISFLLTSHGKWMIIGIIATTTIILPMLFIMILKFKKVINNWNLEKREERIFPFLLTSVFYYLAFYLMKNMQLPGIYYMFILGANLLLILTLIINFWWKISVHMTALGGLLGALIGISQVLKIDMMLTFVLIILLSGIVGFSRLKLNSHTPAQVYTGFAVGVIGMIFLFTGF